MPPHAADSTDPDQEKEEAVRKEIQGCLGEMAGCGVGCLLPIGSLMGLLVWVLRL